LETIWVVPDELWWRLEPILERRYPRKAIGRPRADLRRVTNGVIFRLRTGCQWNQLPRIFGDDSTVHRWFQRFAADGVLEELWAVLVSECGELGAVDWRWQAADGCMGKARFGGEKRGRIPLIEPSPVRSAAWSSRRAAARSGRSSPGANVHDAKLLADTIEAIVAERPDPSACPQHLSLDKGYDNPTGAGAALDGGYIPHIRRIGEEKLDEAGKKRHPARRWVVERTLAWLSKCRAILIRYDKNPLNYLGLIQLACALLWYRRLHRLQETGANWDSY
jgi:putative transposase